MYEKYLTLVLIAVTSGSMIGTSIQFYNDNQYAFAQTNQSPEADDQKVSVNANDNVKITLKGNDDKDDEIEFEIASDPSHGELDNFDKSDGTVTYTPEKDYSGDDKFEFRVIDDKGAESDKASVKIEVKAINQAPEADDQDVSVDANDNIKITLKGDDDDKDDQMEFEIVSDPSHGELDNFDKFDGTVTYTPEKDYSGDDKFEFKVIDNKGAESDKAEIKINVKPLEKTNEEVGGEVNQESQNQTASNESTSTNQSPIAHDQELSTDANMDIDITLTGEDIDNDPIQFEIVSSPTDATLNDFDNTKGTVTYSPEMNYTGNDSFSFKVIDDKSVESNFATVSVEVTENNETNQAPQAFDQVTNEANLSEYRYAVWSAGEEEDRYIFFSRSTDGGKAFSTPLSLSGKIRTSVFNPEVSSSGNIVYVVWQGQSENGNQDIFMRKSVDYGSSFSGVENLSNDPGGSGNPQVTI
ncbi:MAG TPA: Ig-like domain-containing protein, partial [Nitrososphaeraceae archaeon]